ncbi:23S rRNA pseudouridine(2604) synthase RluF [Aequorivita sp. CIP111184]|uniref:23S rRNA pseudouridine(2604) synthase RluF n=1 Tax=Aequorivita sp. CIP111184 TaxID=2211356 RepID=UPI000DBBCB36|nr:23S rRNA pseudouridine(2604) synthase RluF [Aequorivita sp. CIP111184]SRX55424.1 23S rRNA pseudouridine(2604) synthase [Aequorivita sp. CIP111184]
MHHPDSVRLNKAISDSGYCSRREADTLIEKGLVTVNNEKSGLGDRVMPEDEVRVDGKLIKENNTEVFIMLNKPVGITCTTDTRFDDNVVDFVKHPERIFPVGRLDKPSEGLLLLTNEGDIVNKILRAGNKHEKEYIVKVDRHVTDEFVKRMGSGIPILETVTKRCKVERVSRFEFRIILVQGLNRQIRRMCEYLGYEVVALQRIRIMDLELGDLPVGEWRDLTPEELKTLREAVKDSDGLPKVYDRSNRPKIEETIKPEVKRREERNLKREQKTTGGKRRRGPR